MRALLVEDDAVLAEFVGGGLREAGFVVDHEADGAVGLSAALTRQYDVAVIDLMLPGRDGLSIIDEMRKRRVTTPVLILSARRSVDDRVSGLQAPECDVRLTGSGRTGSARGAGRCCRTATRSPAGRC